MKKILTIIITLLTISGLFAKPPKNQYIRIQTTYGQCIIRLYNQTPKLRDNFIKLTKSGFYNGLLFHRLGSDFVVQGGDPASKTAKPGELLGNTTNYSIPFVLNDSLFHKRGAIAMASSDSSTRCDGTQFYIVQGKRFSDAQLDTLEKKRLNGVKIPLWKRDIYKTVGGLPHIDPLLPVFGEVVIGLDMVDRVAMLKTDTNDRPLQDVPMMVSLLSNKECKQLDKLLLSN